MSAILPIVPRAWPDEALSSWVQRVAMFCGGDYELGLGSSLRSGLPLLQHYDVDTDAQARDIVCAWSDTNDTQVPAILRSGRSGHATSAGTAHLSPGMLG